jgi:predicted phage terminase large subunit-like protein
LIGRLLKQKELEKEEFSFELEYINLPALAEEDDHLGRKPGEALWPDRYNAVRLNNKKKTAGPYWWSALYQGSPAARGGTLFKSLWFRYWDFDPGTGDYLCYRINEEEPVRVHRNELIRHTYVDPAIEIKKINDPTGMAACGYSKKHRIWLLLDRISERIEHTKVMEAIKNFAFKNRCTLIGIEDEKLGKVLVKQSEGNDQVGDIKIPFRGIPTKGLDKYARATPMATYTENERVFFPRGALWLAVYESNLVRFPNAEHDEDVDVTAMAQDMETVIPASAGSEPESKPIMNRNRPGLGHGRGGLSGRFKKNELT